MPHHRSWCRGPHALAVHPLLPYRASKAGFHHGQVQFPYMEAHRKVPDRTDILEGSYRAVIEQARQNKQDPDRIFIGGKSMGGRIASQVAATDGVDIDGLFFLGYPLHPPGRTEQLRDAHLYLITRPIVHLEVNRDSLSVNTRRSKIRP